MYPIFEKLAYSKPGKFVATVIRNKYFPAARVHWVQQALANRNFRGL